MGDVMMGKSVRIDGAKCDNLDGRYGERYYIENAHEGIVSKETFYRAQAIRQKRANPKLVKQEHPSYPFTGMIVCGCCGSTYRHKVNNSGKNGATIYGSAPDRNGKAASSATAPESKIRYCKRSS